MKQGEKLPSFNLVGTDDQEHSSGEYMNKTAVVVIFTCNHCPYARAYISRISELVDKYGDEVAFVAINPNDPVKYPEDSFENMKPMARELNINGNYLFDETQEIAKKFSAQRTPEIFLFDQNKKLAYHGAIDDNYQDANAVSNQYLEQAIKSVLNNVVPAITDVPPVGCTIKWK